MNERDVTKACRHQWKRLPVQNRNGLYECVNCHCFGYGSGAGVSPYSGSKRLYEELHKVTETQSGRHGT